jgi:hypothetical protein
MSFFNLVLANLIYIFHIIVILFVLFAPFYDIPAILILHIIFSICLLIHWYYNNNICSLSVMESNLRGIDYTKSFSHQFISPIYDISDTELGNFCYNAVIILCLISFYNLIKSKKWDIFKKCVIETKEYIKKTKDLKFNDKFMLYIQCTDPLFNR